MSNSNKDAILLYLLIFVIMLSVCGVIVTITYGIYDSTAGERLPGTGILKDYSWNPARTSTYTTTSPKGAVQTHLRPHREEWCYLIKFEGENISGCYPEENWTKEYIGSRVNFMYSIGPLSGRLYVKEK